MQKQEAGWLADFGSEAHSNTTWVLQREGQRRKGRGQADFFSYSQPEATCSSDSGKHACTREQRELAPQGLVEV